jgi:hypothetical protein
MFKRPFRRGMIQAANPVVVRAVARANQLLDNGKPADAAEIFSQLAQGGDSRGRPRLGANMHAHAAKAYAQAKNESAALTHSRQALNAFTQLGMAPRAGQFFTNAIGMLRQNGLGEAADSLQKEYGDKLKAASAAGIAPVGRRGRLPAQCPHCAGPARSDEVDWIDEYSAECNYCGGVMRTED